jgi:hypothetical protein
MSVSFIGLLANVNTRLDASGGVLTGNLSLSGTLTAPSIGNAATVWRGDGSALSGIGRSPPTISNISVENVGGTIIGLGGGYIIVNGSGFYGGAIVTVGGIAASSTTCVSMTQLRAQLQAKSAGTYNVQVTNDNGTFALAVDAIAYG